MSTSITLSQSEYKKLLVKLDKIDALLVLLMEKLDIEPAEGTDAWWRWSDKHALEDMKKGEYYELRTKEDIDDFFAHDDDEEYVYHKFHHKGKQAKAKAAERHSKKAHQTTYIPAQ